MAQLKMLLTGQSKRAISGFGSSGLMYATALKTLKEQFGQPSVITRAFVNKVTKSEVVKSNDREALRRFSTDIINCLATLKRLNHMSDINASESLRMIIRRLPDDMILRWKSVASVIREKGESPTLENISNFLRKRVRIDPDFRDIERSTPKSIDNVKPTLTRKTTQQVRSQTVRFSNRTASVKK
ncbi:uncharacterized protein [Haliotis asinina]|uniref:uncharacterized protein n=1 Tax=Haliotis asinina TaxID=109174 RepID=UPI0035319311